VSFHESSHLPVENGRWFDVELFENDERLVRLLRGEVSWSVGLLLVSESSLSRDSLGNLTPSLSISSDEFPEEVKLFSAGFKRGISELVLEE